MSVNVKSVLLPKQIEYIQSESDIAIYDGGVGAGKSIADVILAIKYALEYPGIDILICAPTYGMLRDTIMREFEAKCPVALLQKFNRGQYPEATFTEVNGVSSSIRFRAFDSAGKPKGLTVGLAIIDEVTEMEEDVLDEIINRVRQYGMPNRLRFSTNPDSEEHYFYKRFIEPVELKHVTKSQIHRVHTTTYENYLLPQNYLRNLEILKKTRPGKYRQSVLGEWGDFDEGMIGAFAQIDKFTSPYLVAFIDNSYSDKAKSDMTSVSVVGFLPSEKNEETYWPIEFTGMSWQASMTNPEVIVAMLSFLDKYKPIETCLESQLSDSTSIFIDRLKDTEKKLNLSVKNHWTYLHQTKNKHERIMFEVAGNKNRLHVLKETDPLYLSKIIQYTKGKKHEDEADSLAGAIYLWRTSKVLQQYIYLMRKKSRRGA